MNLSARVAWRRRRCSCGKANMRIGVGGVKPKRPTIQYSELRSRLSVYPVAFGCLLVAVHSLWQVHGGSWARASATRLHLFGQTPVGYGATALMCVFAFGGCAMLYVFVHLVSSVAVHWVVVYRRSCRDRWQCLVGGEAPITYLFMLHCVLRSRPSAMPETVALSGTTVVILALVGRTPALSSRGRSSDRRLPPPPPQAATGQRGGSQPELFSTHVWGVVPWASWCICRGLPLGVRVLDQEDTKSCSIGATRKIRGIIW